MTFLRFFLRLFANVCLCCALALVPLWLLSYSYPFRLDRTYSLGPAKWVWGSQQVVLNRGGVWSFRMETRPVQPPPVIRPANYDGRWVFRELEENTWEERLPRVFVGERRLGFHDNVFQRRESLRATDGVTPIYRDIPVIFEHRAFRLPLATVAAALCVPTALRVVLAIVPRRRAKAMRPSLPRRFAGTSFELLATASLLLFAVAVWQWAHTRNATTVLAQARHWTAERYVPAAGSPQVFNCHDGRSLEVNCDGWEVVRATHDVVGVLPTNTAPPLDLRAGYATALISPAAAPTGAVDDFGSHVHRAAGFAFARATRAQAAASTLAAMPPLRPPPPPPPGPITQRWFTSRMPIPPQVPAVAGWGVRVPHWAVLFATGVLPATWLLTRLRRDRSTRRRQAGQCPACGYDLRATPERCPECGFEPAAGGASAP